MAEESTVLSQILSVASRHPATKVAKLIYEYQDDRSRTTLVLLLEEVAQNTQFVTDFDIVLDYYMRRFIKIIQNSDGAFNECGRMLDAIARIWGRRVEEVYDRIAEQTRTLTLSCQDAEARAKEKENESNAEKSEPIPKAKRRRRPIDPDPYDVTMEIKKFRAMQPEKLFAQPQTLTNPVITPNYFAEDHLNPALWRHSFIIDPDNPDNKDSKRNYKVFAYHIEHRYNTPVNDYNFRWHFAIKDYIDESEMDIDTDFAADNDKTSIVNMEQWRPQTYLQKAITLENQAFERHLAPTARKRPPDNTLGIHIEKLARISLEASNAGMDSNSNAKQKVYQTQDSGIGDSILDDNCTQDTFSGEISTQESDPTMAGMTSLNKTVANQTCDDSGNGTLEMSNTANESTLNGDQSTINGSLNASTLRNDSGINSSLELTLPEFNQSSVLESTKLDETENNGNSIDLGFGDALNNASDKSKDLSDVTTITDKLPQSDDEGIVLSDQEETYINTTNLIPENQNSKLLPHEEIFDLKYPLVKNVLNLTDKHLRRYVLFKLPLELNLLQLKQPDKPKTQKKANESKKDPVKEIKTALNKYKSMGMPDSFFEFIRNRKEQLECFDEDSCCSVTDDIDFIGYSEEMHLVYGGEPPPFWTDDQQYIYPKNNDTFNEDEPKGNETVMEIKAQEAQDKVFEAGEPSNDQSTTPMELSETHINTNTNVSTNETVSKDANAEAVTSMCTVNADGNEDISTYNNDDEDARDDDDDWDQEMQTETDLKIRDWHRLIAPSLAAAHERQHFSVYDIGSKIINKLSDGAETLKDLVEDEEPTDISKVFLSLLMLTNQKNVALDRGVPNYDEPTDLANLKVELISTQRHKVAFEDDIGQHDDELPTTSSKSSTKKTAQSSVIALKQHNVNTKMVRTLQSIPKVIPADDNDSGISSMASSVQTKDSHS